MLADRVRMSSGGNNDVSVNIKFKDTSQYVRPADKLYIMPIIKGFELDPSKFDTSGHVEQNYVKEEIVPLYCGDAIEVPRHSTINVTTLKSKYFIIKKEGFSISVSVRLTNRDLTVKHLSFNMERNNIFRLSEDLEDGDIIELKLLFD